MAIPHEPPLTRHGEQLKCSLDVEPEQLQPVVEKLVLQQVEADSSQPVLQPTHNLASPQDLLVDSQFPQLALL